MKIRFLHSLSLLILFKLNFLSSNSWLFENGEKFQSNLQWLVGCNYIPSTAVNVIEMWQDDTFEQTLQTTSIEMQSAQFIGFNSVRVFLNFILWQQDPVGFKHKIDRFIDAVILHEIRIIFVLFDDRFHGDPELGPQKPPIPGVYNSRWVQSPGQRQATNTTLYPDFKNYVQDILQYFKYDSRIIMWDLFNEPGNRHSVDEILPLLINIFTWAREVNATQPLTAGLFKYDENFNKINEFQLNNSDIVTFHHYGNLSDFINLVKMIKSKIGQKSLVCTEYMARQLDSLFETHLPYMKLNNIGALNWGLVSGKTQTIYPWWSKPHSLPPEIWFQDIFQKNGGAFNDTEINIITNQTLVDKYF